MATSPAKEPFPDEDIVRLVRDGDAAAFPILLDRYLPVLRSRAWRYCSIAGADVEDFIQEGMFALFRAVRGYNNASGAGFGAYAVACINNSMSTAVKKHFKDSRHISPVCLYDLDEQNLYQQAPSDFRAKPVEDSYLDQEAIVLRARQIETLLSEFEQQVLRLYLNGHTYQKIAVVLSTTTKAVDNALQRVRRKLRPEP